jgi:anti-sigma28 factor (negative regulator of flagellin synthesis)
MNTSKIQSDASGKLARQMASMRHKKIQSLKTKITSGKYRVDNLSIAKALFLAR